MNSIKCAECGYEAPASVFDEEKRCPRGRDPKPKKCGQNKPLTAEQADEAEKVGGSSGTGAVQGARTSAKVQ